VIDNSAKDGSGVADCERLHRIDEKVVREDILRAASSSRSVGFPAQPR